MTQTLRCSTNHWLNEHILRAHGFLYALPGQNLYEAGPLEALVQRLLKSSGHLERRDAAFVLSRLLWSRRFEKERLRADLRLFAHGSRTRAEKIAMPSGIC